MSDSMILRRGETGLPTLEVYSGDAGEVTEITARMRLTFAPNTEVGVTVVPRVDPPVGWDLLITEEQSMALALGVWQLDVRLVVGASVIVTDPVAVTVAQTASAG